MATKKKTKTPARRKRATTARASSVRGSVARRIEREHDALAATEADHHAIEHCSCELAAQWRDAQSMPPPQPRPARKFGLTFLELRALAEVASPNEIVRAAHRALQAGTITPEQSDAAENWAIAKADAGI
jgi:hypothetical protein